jgi:hypothetical protein
LVEIIAQRLSGDFIRHSMINLKIARLKFKRTNAARVTVSFLQCVLRHFGEGFSPAKFGAVNDTVQVEAICGNGSAVTSNVLERF